MKTLHIALLLISCFALQACVHKIVTVPVKVAYKTTKAVGKGVIAVGKAVIPDGDDESEHKKKK